MDIPGQASDVRLIQLRDRCGLLTPDVAWMVLQRLTWIWRTPEAVTLINRAIDDVDNTEAEERPHPSTVRCPAGRHWMIRTEKQLPCPYCEFYEALSGRSRARD
ncbi:MAG TPA: hypothetical protein VGR71_11805 [Nitrospira sp.]|nr:hypothetical protein [Nitrospira sp.]